MSRLPPPRSATRPSAPGIPASTPSAAMRASSSPASTRIGEPQALRPGGRIPRHCWHRAPPPSPPPPAVPPPARRRSCESGRAPPAPRRNAFGMQPPVVTMSRPMAQIAFSFCNVAATRGLGFRRSPGGPSWSRYRRSPPARAPRAAAARAEACGIPQWRTCQIQSRRLSEADAAVILSARPRPDSDGLVMK